MRRQLAGYRKFWCTSCMATMRMKLCGRHCLTSPAQRARLATCSAQQVLLWLFAISGTHMQTRLMQWGWAERCRAATWKLCEECSGAILARLASHTYAVRLFLVSSVSSSALCKSADHIYCKGQGYRRPSIACLWLQGLWRRLSQFWRSGTMLHHIH